MREETNVVLRGGPHDGRTVTVVRTAGHCPLFLGVEGSNYLPAGRTDVEGPVYRWAPVRARDILVDRMRRRVDADR